MKTTRTLALLFALVGMARAALPTIDTQPANSTNCVGTAASFTVVASSDSSTNYQWYFNETNVIANATNATYAIASVAPANAGGYSVVVSNVDGAVTSIVAQLVVNTLTTAAGPSNTNVCPGASVTFETIASGTGPFSYVWRKDGGAPLGSTSNTLELVGITAGDAGVYSVEVTGACNSVTNSATLGLNTLTAASGPDNTNKCAGSSVTLATTASGTGPFSYVWRKDGGAPLSSTSNSLTISPVTAGDAGTYSVEVTGACNSVTNSATLSVTAQPSLVVTADTNDFCPGTTVILTATSDAASPTYLWSPGGATTQSVTNTPGVTTVYSVTVTDGVTGCSSNGSLTINVNTLTTTSAIGNATNCPGTPVTFTTTASGTGPFTYVWRKDGTLVQGPDGNNSYTIASVTTGDAGTYSVEVSGTCNTVTNSGNLVVAGAPNITAQPQNQATPMGNGAVFSVTATTVSGTVAPLSYQWFTNGVDAGVTTSSIAISNVTFADSGRTFQVIVSNCAGSVTSSVATLTVTPVSGISFDFDTPGQFTNAPYYLTYNNWFNGAFVSPPGVFETAIGGTGPFPGSGALDLIPNNGSENSSVLLPVSFDFSLPGKTIYASTMFRLKNPTSNSRSSQFGFVTATNLGVNDQTPQGFMTVILQSTAQPAPTYELRHQRRTSGGGLMESTLTPTASLVVSNWYKLSIAFTNTRTAGDSNYAVAATLQDMGPLGTSNGAVVLSFATGTNNADMVNFRNVYLALRGFENTGVDYRDNTYAWTTPGNIFFVQEPQSQTVSQGTRAVFKAYVDGEGPYTYQWQRDDGIGGFTNIPLAGSWNYIAPPALTGDNGSQYRVVVTGPANTITSSPATLTVTAQTLAVVSAGSVDGTTVGVLFNQPVDPASAETVGNYTINGVNPVQARVYRTSVGPQGPDGIYVVLTPASVLSGSFTVVATGVQDLSGGAVGGANSAMGSVAGLTGYDVNPAIVGPPGENYSFADGEFIVTGGGVDIWNNADSFRFVYTTKTGDFDIKAKIPYMDAVNTSSKAGFDARPLLDPFSIQILAAVNPGFMAGGSGGIRQFTEGTYRTNYNNQPPGTGSGSWGSGTRVNYPDVWLRFRRSGQTFMRYVSTDGVNWSFNGQVTPNPVFPDTIYVGLTVCAVRNLHKETAQFENYGPFAGYSGATIAISSEPTNFTVSAGSTFVNGMVASVSGGGIPASAGELTYVWQRSDGGGGFTNLPNSGATNNTISLGPLWSSDNGAVFRAVLKAPGAPDLISATFTATVTDTAAPTVTSANSGIYPSYPVSEVLINFSELVSGSGTNVANYSVTNAAGAVLNVLSATFLNGDPRNVLLTLDGQLGFGTSFVGISGVQDLNGNTLATVVRSFRSYAPSTGPVVNEYYEDIGTGGSIAALTGHATYTAGQPSWISYSNVFGANALSGFGGSTFPGNTFSGGTAAHDNYGVKAYTYFVPSTSGQFKFWIRGDDFAQFYMNTNSSDSTNPAGRVLIAELTGNSANYIVGTVPANSKTNITLVAGQSYYMEFLMKETGGGDGYSVMFTAPTVNTAPGQTTYIPTANLAYPNGVAPKTPVVSEFYTGYVPALSGNGNLPTLISATNFPTSSYIGVAPNFKYIANLPDAVVYQKYFATQPQLGQTRVDNYLGRMISYFVPPTNGTYKFFLRADDAAQIYMNTNSVDSTSAAGKSLIGRVDVFTSAYTLVAQNISLTGGQKYYLEGLWREGGGGDGMAVAVRAQGDGSTPPTAPPETIPASMLDYPMAYGRAGAVNFTGILPSGPFAEGQSVTLLPTGVSGGMMSGAGNFGSAGTGYGFIWFRNGVPILANSFTNVLPPLTMADNGAVYTLVITNQFSRAERSLVASVSADTTAPAVIRTVGWRYGDGFTIQFNERVDATSATFLGNYAINNGLRLISASLDPSGTMVSIRTSQQTAGTSYAVTINGVKDVSVAGNVVNTMTSFSSWAVGGNGILVEFFTNIIGGTIADLVGTVKFQANMPDAIHYTNIFGVGPFGADSGREFYGARVTAYFIPTNTSYYRFYLRSDDASQLYMNINSADSENPAGKVMLIHQPNANVSFQDPRSISPPVFLNQGQRYFMEALMKEGTGGDYMALTFRATDANGTAVGVVPPADNATELQGAANFGGVPGDPDLVQVSQTPPTELTVTENDLVTLTLVANVPASIAFATSYQWQKTNSGSGTFTNIPGANAPSLSFFAQRDDDGSHYRILFSAPGKTTAYSTLLHVLCDVSGVGPAIIAASTLDGVHIGIRYNKPVDMGTGGEGSNYAVNNGAVNVLSAVIRESIDPRTVILTIDQPVTGTTFTLDALSIGDRSSLSCGGPFYNDSVGFIGTIQNLLPFDVGSPLQVGSSFSTTNGEIDVVAGGADIWGTSDQGHLTLGQRSGDFDIWAQVQSLTRPDAISKAGVMVRETTNADSRTLTLLGNPPASIGGRDLAEAAYRSLAAGATAAWPNTTNVTPFKIPNAWLRMKREGFIWRAFYSSNGVDWVGFATNFAGFPRTVYVGLATTAHNNNSAPTVAQYRNVHIPNPPTITTQPSPASQTIPLHGSTSYTVVAANPPDSGSLSYVWRRDGMTVVGTSATLSIPDAMGVDSGVYTVEVGNDGGSVISDPVTLTVNNGLPTIGSDTISATQNMSTAVSAASLIANDSDPEGSNLVFQGVSGIVPVMVQTNFTEGNLTGATLYGTAYHDVTNGYLRLHNNVNSAGGSIVINDLTPGKRLGGFTASFKLRISEGSGEPADGFSFNFGPDLPDAATGVTPNEDGLGTGFSFCVDNYRFAPYPGPGTPRVAYAGSANTSGMKIVYGGTNIIGVQVPTWNRPAFVPVIINLTGDGQLTVFVDGTNVFGTITLPYVGTTGRFGMYSRTGGQNESTFVDDLKITALTVDTAGGGAVTYSSGSGNVTYTALTACSGTDTFYYLVNDGQVGGDAVAPVTVNITESNPQAPTIVNCPTNRTVLLYTNTQYTLPDLTSEFVVTDTCGTPTKSQSPVPGTLLNEGTNIVAFVATDAGSLSSTCQVSIVVQVVRPQIIPGSISYGGGTFSGSFQTQNGVNYRVEYKDDLNAVSWTLLTTIAGDGTVKTFTDPGPLPPTQRFYRIVPTP